MRFVRDAENNKTRQVEIKSSFIRDINALLPFPPQIVKKGNVKSKSLYRALFYVYTFRNKAKDH